jgi:hypothetical protein
MSPARGDRSDGRAEEEWNRIFFDHRVDHPTPFAALKNFRIPEGNYCCPRLPASVKLNGAAQL